MSVLPIDSGRYGNEDVKKIFTEETRFQKMLDVEAALAWAQSQVGEIPEDDASFIITNAKIEKVSLKRVKEIEKRTKHETMALVEGLIEVCGSSGAYVHLGATSSDILDTALALQLNEAFRKIEDRLRGLMRTLKKLTEKNSETLMIGRTHGQHAVPITLGFKFANWIVEIGRQLSRLQECKDRALVGKMSGAVGTQAGLGPNSSEIQKLVMKRLGLKPVEISTQIVSRDSHAELVSVLANIASSLDKFATEIRELQRPEINELAEPFMEETQIGSSTMPHKKNPVVCERISGLARIVRGLVNPAFENSVTWHERDLSHSSAERFIVPEACILVDYMVSLMNNVLTGLIINKDNMKRNIMLSQGRVLAESVMMRLIRRGMNRKEAYDLTRRISRKSEKEKTHFKNSLMDDIKVCSLLNEKEIAEALNPENYLGNAHVLISKVLEKYQL
jgi:adenylosuccinate lyase